VDPRPRALLMVGIFVGLLAFHVWLLYRMVGVANWLLAGFLLVAIALFGWRIAHYAALYRGVVAGKAVRGPAEERRQIRLMAPVLAGMLVLHAWLITVTVAAGEVAFTVLLLLAVVVFVARLALYARRYAKLRSDG